MHALWFCLLLEDFKAFILIGYGGGWALYFTFSFPLRSITGFQSFIVDKTVKILALEHPDCLSSSCAVFFFKNQEQTWIRYVLTLNCNYSNIKDMSWLSFSSKNNILIMIDMIHDWFMSLRLGIAPFCKHDLYCC